MSHFSDPAAMADYVARTTRIVPGMQALHRMAGILLAEHTTANARILVLGAGGGLELKAFSQMQPAWRFDGVDPSAVMLDLARHTLAPMSPHIQLHLGDIGHAPLGPYDGASCLLTLHFLSPEDRLHTLRQIRQRLRPGAPLVVAHHSMPDDAPTRRRWLARNAAFAAPDGAAVPNAAGRAINTSLPVLTPQQDEALLREAGFTDIELFYCAFTFRGWVARSPAGLAGGASVPLRS